MWLGREVSTHLRMFHFLPGLAFGNETKLNKTKDFDFSQPYSVLYQRRSGIRVPGAT